MPSPTIYSLAPPILSHPVRRLLESGETIQINSLIAISKGILANVFLVSRIGGFIASVCGSRYTIGQPVAVLRSWLSDFGVPILAKEVPHA